MKLKQAFRYQLSDIVKPIVIFYIVIAAIITSMIVTVAFAFDGTAMSSNGLEMASFIFLFVCGLNSFKENFRMYLQNSLSRKTLFFSVVSTMVVVSFGMAFIDGLIARALTGTGYYDSLFIMSYLPYVAKLSPVLSFIAELCWNFFLYLFGTMLGLFITIGYYRMNRPAKLCVSIGIPSLIFIILPMVDGALFGGKVIIVNCIRFLMRIVGRYNTCQPWIAVITFFVLSVVFGALARLLMRKAIIKND